MHAFGICFYSLQTLEPAPFFKLKRFLFHSQISDTTRVAVLDRFFDMKQTRLFMHLSNGNGGSVTL